MKDFLRLHRTFVIVLFVGLFAMATRNVLDPDVWWHLKTGEWIVRHGTVPHADPFSYTRAGQPWTVHEWLCQVAMYGLFRWAGYSGLIIVFAAIISTAFIPLCLRCRTNMIASAAVTVWGALATEVVWGVRPQILSFCSAYGCCFWNAPKKTRNYCGGLFPSHCFGSICMAASFWGRFSSGYLLRGKFSRCFSHLLHVCHTRIFAG